MHLEYDPEKFCQNNFLHKYIFNFIGFFVQD